MPYCANCGSKLEGMESFCPFCGEIIKSSPKGSQFSTNSQIEALKNEVSSLRQQVQNQNKPIIYPQQKQNSTCWICCCLTIFIMFVLGFVPWFFFWFQYQIAILKINFKNSLFFPLFTFKIFMTIYVCIFFLKIRRRKFKDYLFQESTIFLIH